jgi:hypothetical protein
LRREQARGAAWMCSEEDRSVSTVQAKSQQ